MPILLVREDDGSETYYEIFSNKVDILTYINDSIITFTSPNILCNGKSLLNQKIVDFISKFRYGRHHNEWKILAKQLYSYDIIYKPKVSLCYDYSVFLNH